MSLFDFIQHFILFVVPGVITYLLFSHLTGSKPLSDLFSVLLVFIFSTLAYLLGNLGLFLLNLIPDVDFQLADISQILTGNTNNITTQNIIASLISSVIIGLLAVLVWDKRLLFRIANLMKITGKTDNCEAWDYMFDTQPWVIVRDYVSGNVYYGRVERYSDRSSIRELLLNDVRVFCEDDSEYHMEQVYLSRTPSEFSIEIDDYANANITEEDNNAESKVDE